MQDMVDVLIIGAGASGAAVAWSLAETKMRILCRERAWFVTTAYRNGVLDEEIMGHTRHRSLTTMPSCVRRAKLSQASPAGKLGH